MDVSEEHCIGKLVPRYNTFDEDDLTASGIAETCGRYLGNKLTEEFAATAVYPSTRNLTYKTWSPSQIDIRMSEGSPEFGLYVIKIGKRMYMYRLDSAYIRNVYEVTKTITYASTSTFRYTRYDSYGDVVDVKKRCKKVRLYLHSAAIVDTDAQYCVGVYFERKTKSGWMFMNRDEYDLSDLYVTDRPAYSYDLSFSSWKERHKYSYRLIMLLDKLFDIKRRETDSLNVISDKFTSLCR